MTLHYRAPGWLNDPHGIFFHDGRYHLFHQSVPHALAWEPGISWGHAVGPDLASFSYLGTALAPGDGDDGIWTGCIVVDDAGPKAYYTSVQEPQLGLSRIRVARPTDAGLTSWVKGEVVATAPPGVVKDFRDPFVLREADGWRMFVGSDSDTGAAVAHTYTCGADEQWVYDAVALSRPSTLTDPWLGSLWECPQFFEVAGSWVMLTSVWHDQQTLWASYAIGALAQGRFTARAWGRLSFGTLYAPTVFKDRAGRVSMMAWVREATGDGWAGCLTIPYLLSVTGDRLVAVPHDDVAGRGQRWLPQGRLTLPGAELVATADAVVVRAAGREAQLPHSAGEEVEVFFDDAAIEVVGSGGIVALPMAP